MKINDINDGILNHPPLRPGGITLTKSAIDFCGFDRDDIILDAGCGYGITTKFIYDEFGIAVFGLDLSQDKLNRACETLSYKDKCGKTGRFVCAKIPFMPFKAEVFNGIFCECVLSLILEKKICIQEFYRILKKNGNLIITDLYIPDLYILNNLQNIPSNYEEIIFQYKNQYKNKDKNKVINKDKHAAYSCIDGAITILSLKNIIEDAGFVIELVEDHSNLLKQFAGQMVFNYGSLESFWNIMVGKAGNIRNIGHIQNTDKKICTIKKQGDIENTDKKTCDNIKDKERLTNNSFSPSVISKYMKFGYCVIIAKKVF